MRSKLIVLCLVLLVLIIAHLLWGSVNISLAEIGQAIWGETPNEMHQTILWDFRFPKILTAMLAGASLSVSGLLMQTFFRNPVAGPFVLGISSGASLGVAILVMSAGSLVSIGVDVGSPWAMILMAMLGAVAVLVILLIVSQHIRDVNTLLILGLMFGSATGAIVSLLQYFSSQDALQQFVLWSMGSLTATTWQELYWLSPVCILTIILVLGMSKTLDVLLLGEQYALSMGVSIKQAQKWIVLTTAILAGSITAFCGPIAFVGIAVPHLARIIFQTHQHLTLLLATVLLGMITLLFCQLIAQLPSSNNMLPINVVTAFMGAPMVIWIVISRGRK